MAWRRWYTGCSLLLLIMAGACDGGQSFAPSFLMVSPPGGLTATAVAFNQISLAWQDNSRNESGFEIHRSADPNGPFALIATADPLATGFGDGTVNGLTQYCYKVRAFRVTGKKTTYSDFSSVACATTPPAPVPAAASGVAAAPNLGSTIRVIWTDNSSDETGFRIERAASAAGPWTTIANFPSNSTTLFDFAIALEQQRCYRVFAVNSFGDSDPSNVACTAVPTAPSNLLATVAGTAVDLTWTDNSGVEDGFEVQRAAEGGIFSVIATVGPNVTTYHDADLVPDNTYTYFVRATKDGGTSGSSNTAQAVVATSAPQAPFDLNAVPSGSNGVVVFWTDGSNNEQGFRVERSTDGGASWVAAGTTGMNETAFGDAAASELEVCYRVIAFNGVGDSPASNTDCTTPPAGPTDFTAIAIDDNTVDLAWTDNSAVEDGYQVWVDDGFNGAFPVADLPAGTTSFQLVGFYPFGFWFGVAAVKDGGYSDFQWTFAAPPAGVARVRGAPPKAFHPRGR